MLDSVRYDERALVLDVAYPQLQVGEKFDFQRQLGLEL